MAHQQQFRFIHFVKQTLPYYFKDKIVLEVGSLNINGSVRDFFVDSSYTGIDVAEGKDVDLVVKGENYAGQANSIDVVISCECFEHNPEYEKTFINMVRVLKKDGLFIMTCATHGRKQHGTSLSDPAASPLTIIQGQDYYKNLIEDDFQFFNLKHLFVDYFFVTDSSSSDLYFLGLGKDADKINVAQFSAGKEMAINFYRQVACSGLSYI